MPLARLPFWSRSRCALAVGALAFPSLVLGLVGTACGTNDADEAQGGTGGSSGQAGSDTGTGVGGNDADATVPDAQPDVTPPTYADLCGDGVCVPGPDDGCQE